MICVWSIDPWLMGVLDLCPSSPCINPLITDALCSGTPTAKCFPSRAAMPPVPVVGAAGQLWGHKGVKPRGLMSPWSPPAQQTCVPVLTAKSQNQLEIKGQIHEFTSAALVVQTSCKFSFYAVATFPSFYVLAALLLKAVFKWLEIDA